MAIPFRPPQQSPAISGWQGKPISGRVLYVDGQHYLKGYKIYHPHFEKMADAFKELRQGDTIIVYGKIDESGLVAPNRNITDVTICGMGTRTRPGHGGESAMGGAADWSAEKDNETDPLLTIISQGWSIRDIHFGGGKRASTVKLLRTDDMTASAGHAEFRNVAFSGGVIGIEECGGNTNVGIYNSQFYGYRQPGSAAIKGTSTSVGWPLWWEIVGNRFFWNDVHIDLDPSNSIVRGNYFFMEGPEGPRNKVALDLYGGKNNIVDHNQFGCRSDEPGYVNEAYKMGAGDAWGPNYCSDKEIYGAPKEN